MIKLEMTRKQEAILAAIIIFAALGVFVLYTGIGTAPEPEPPAPEPEPAPVSSEPAPKPPTTEEIIIAHIEQYDSIAESHIEALENGDYTIGNPLIIVNPYGPAPLSALVLFDTEEPMRISLQVAGKSPDVSVSHTFNKYETRHIVPVYGLYRRVVNIVEITAEPRVFSTAETQNAIVMIATDTISEAFPRNIIFQELQAVPVNNVILNVPDIPPPEIEIPLDDDTGMTGNVIIQEVSYDIDSETDAPAPFYFTFGKKSAFDIYGDYRWSYQGFESIYPTDYNQKGNMLIIVGSFETEDAHLLEIDMLGRIVSYKAIDEEYEITGHGPQNAERRAIYSTL